MSSKASKTPMTELFSKISAAFLFEQCFKNVVLFDKHAMECS